jgi:REP element-mobilizing transposase RayT
VALPLRDRDPSSFRILTIRTAEARLWILPTQNINKIVGGILARYQEILGIELYAYAVLGNHLHLVARAPRANIDEFEENVNREIARRLNWKFHLEGQFWSRRYDDLKILSENDLLKAFLYISTNPTRHGLVENSKDWPGLVSYKQSLDERERQFTFYHYSAASEEQRTTVHSLRLSVLPQFKHLTKERRRHTIEGLLRQRTRELIADRKAKGLGFLGLEGLKRIVPGERPRDISRANRPPCYTECLKLRREFIKLRKEFSTIYRRCSVRYRLGDRSVKFPSFSFLPPVHRAPRLGAFRLLDINHEKI